MTVPKLKLQGAYVIFPTLEVAKIPNAGTIVALLEYEEGVAYEAHVPVRSLLGKLDGDTIELPNGEEAHLTGADGLCAILSAPCVKQGASAMVHTIAQRVAKVLAAEHAVQVENRLDAVEAGVRLKIVEARQASPFLDEEVEENARAICAALGIIPATGAPTYH